MLTYLYWNSFTKYNKNSYINKAVIKKPILFFIIVSKLLIYRNIYCYISHFYKSKSFLNYFININFVNNAFLFLYWWAYISAITMCFYH